MKNFCMKQKHNLVLCVFMKVIKAVSFKIGCWGGGVGVRIPCIRSNYLCKFVCKRFAF